MKRWLERGLFASRWLMAPFYAGLVLALAVLLYKFIIEVVHFALSALNMSQNDAVLGILSLIDLSLTGNLILIIIFSGYESFVSEFDLDDHKDRPGWEKNADFSEIKLNVLSSIIGISAIELLKIFMNVSNTPAADIRWMVIIHVVFLFSGVMLALMDKINAAIKLAKNK